MFSDLQGHGKSQTLHKWCLFPSFTSYVPHPSVCFVSGWGFYRILVHDRFQAQRLRNQLGNWSRRRGELRSSGSAWGSASPGSCRSLPCHSHRPRDQRSSWFCAVLFGRFIGRTGFGAPTAIFLCGEKVGWIEPVSHLFRQLDCAEMDGWLPEVAPRRIFYCQRYQRPSSGV